MSADPFKVVTSLSRVRVELDAYSRTPAFEGNSPIMACELASLLSRLALEFDLDLKSCFCRSSHSRNSHRTHMVRPESCELTPFD